MSTVISVENLSKAYRLGQIGTGTLTYDMKLWWAKVRGKPNPLLKIGEQDHGNRGGETIWALKDVSFKVEQGEVLGIIGRNGAGKSTLLKILSRVTAPTSGRITGKGRIASLLEVGTGFHPELTGRENIYLNGAILGMNRREIDRKFDEIVDFAEIEKFIDTPVKRYSSGMYVRLAFAIAAHLEPEILVVDEVLAVGDAEFQKKCLGKMSDVAKKGRTVLFVSHNMAAVKHLCSKGLLLQKGQTVIFSRIGEVINNYLSNIRVTQLSKLRLPHVIYENNQPNGDFTILSIELFDEEGRPKNQVSTWDTVDLKIRYSARRAVKNGSLVIKISDHFGNTLMLLSTQPDSKVSMSIEKGESTAHCIIENIPLSGGDYMLGCGLAVPNKEWLCWDENLTTFTVTPKDIFNSGLAPTNSRALLAVQHRWIINQ
jgi:lipopolysaccharide transport system ATP-binding protein